METEYHREPVTRSVYERPWTADLETAAHASDRRLVVAEALDAVTQTEPGVRIDVVTPEEHGHPETYLYPRLSTAFDSVEVETLGRCHCGGYVSRIRTEGC